MAVSTSSGAKRAIFIFAWLLLLPTHLAQAHAIREYASFHLGEPIGQCRAVPVASESGKPENILLIYGRDENIDPFAGMFFFPTGPLKFALYTPEGKRLWQVELHRGNIPGLWFIPVFPFDLDQDGREEIWFIHNREEEHPLNHWAYELTRMDPGTGRILGNYPWKVLPYNNAMSHRYRNFIFGGYDQGKPVLVTAQGTYTELQLQGWNPDMTQKWDVVVEADAPGSRGSHSCPVVDIDFDGTDEFLYGERCISVRDGRSRFIADEHTWNGHSDVVAPTLNLADHRWYVFTIRESGYNNHAPPRVVMFKDDGTRLWTDLEAGHMDMGWSARLGPQGEARSLAVKIGKKVAGRDGVFRAGVEEFFYDSFTGERIPHDFQLYLRLPVDIDGDGIHELIGSGTQVDGRLLDRTGKEIHDFGEECSTALLSKFLDKPGEQLLLYYPDGRVVIAWDEAARDTPAGRRRFESPHYRSNQKLTAVGYNLAALGGL